MNGEQVINSDDFKRCADFHGHVCPGLSMGYKAAKMALSRLNETRADDEEIVAIVETDACSADAVQVLTGCTFGKGNFIYKDYGKMALTLLSRRTGKGVRVIMRPDVFSLSEEHRMLLQKVTSGQARSDETERFQTLHLQASKDMLAMNDHLLFDIHNVEMKLPPKARIDKSELCSKCKEPTMACKLHNIEGALVCRGCIANLD